MYRAHAHRRSALVLAGIVTLGTSASLLACPPTDVLYAGSGDAATPLDAADGGVPAAGDADCARARVPPRPDASDGPDGPPILFALRALSVVTDAGAPPLGFDLDGLCSCDESRARAACTAALKECHDEGRDIATLDLISAPGFADFYGPNNQGIAAGGATALFEIRGYNGEPDDPSVRLVISASNGNWERDDAGAYVDGGSVVPPKWDGTDVWSASETATPGLFSFDEAGWVSNGWAVVEANMLPGGLIPLVRGGQLDIRDVRLVGRITNVDGHLEIADGQVAGRISASQLLASLRLRPVIDGGCYSDTSSSYELTQKAVCAARDMMLLKAQDNTGLACDALSYAAGFTAVRASKGEHHDALPGNCANARIDDSGCSP